MRFVIVSLIVALTALACGGGPRDPGARGPGPVGSAATAVGAERPIVNFPVNVHDYVHHDDSAAAVLRFVEVFTKHGVRGDFYLTAQVAEKLRDHHPDVIERLKSTGMGIGYHVRPPHPVAAHFEDRVRGLDDAALERTLRDYETYALDLSNGELIRDRSGGYSLVSGLFGPPVVVSMQAGDPRVRATAARVYRGLGARMVVWGHEGSGDRDQPLQWHEGLLGRPSDLQVARLPASQGRQGDFWWNRLRDPNADPSRQMADLVAGWKGGRAPYVTAVIHENNVYQRGAASWTLAYFTDDRMKTRRDPPWPGESPPESSTPRSEGEMNALWDAYDRMVGWAATNGEVLTAAEIVARAGAPK